MSGFESIYTEGEFAILNIVGDLIERNATRTDFPSFRMTEFTFANSDRRVELEDVSDSEIRVTEYYGEKIVAEKVFSL